MKNNRLLRTFVAVTIPREVLAIRDMLKTTISFSKPNLRWSKDGNIHFTLKFIGHTPPKGIPAIVDGLYAVSKRHSPTQHVIQNTGVFPVAERPRTLWVGVEDNLDPLRSLVGDINETLDSLGYPAETQEYKPHITIGRIKYPPNFTPDVSQYIQASFQPIPIRVDRFLLISSELQPTGPVYTNLQEFTLAEL